MTLKKNNSALDSASRRDFIIKGTLAGGLIIGIGAVPELALAQSTVPHDHNSPTK